MTTSDASYASDGVAMVQIMPKPLTTPGFDDSAQQRCGVNRADRTAADSPLIAQSQAELGGACAELHAAPQGQKQQDTAPGSASLSLPYTTPYFLMSHGYPAVTDAALANAARPVPSHYWPMYPSLQQQPMLVPSARNTVPSVQPLHPAHALRPAAALDPTAYSMPTIGQAALQSVVMQSPPRPLFTGQQIEGTNQAQHIVAAMRNHVQQLSQHAQAGSDATSASPPGAATISRGPPVLNSRGFPMRPGEPECAYYMKNGTCAFGSACKFHHPDFPNSMSMMYPYYPYGMPYSMPGMMPGMMPQYPYMSPYGPLPGGSGAPPPAIVFVPQPPLPPRPKQRQSADAVAASTTSKPT